MTRDALAILGSRRADLATNDRRIERWSKPSVFATDVFPEDYQLVGYQDEILDAIPDNLRVSARGPRGLGKTALSAIGMLWFVILSEMMCTPWKAVVTSGSHYQIRQFFWPEVHLWARRMNWDQLPFPQWDTDSQLLKTRLSLDHGQASSASPDRPELIEGAHAERVMVVLDESKAIPQEIWDSLEGVFSNIGAASSDVGYALAVSTPGAPSGPFYNIHAQRPGLEIWWTRHVTRSEAIAAGRITKEYGERLGKLWGVNSALYHNHVEGTFRADDSNACIPLEWVEAAMNRWLERMHPEDEDQRWHPPVYNLHAGIDVARLGGDSTIIAPRIAEDHIDTLEELPKQETVQTTNDIELLLKKGATVTIDVGGLGVGIYDALKSRGWNVTAYSGAGMPDEWTDASGLRGAYNRRSAAWWAMRELLDPALDKQRGFLLHLPPDDELKGHLVAPVLSQIPDPKNRIRLENKLETTKRLGSSPDRGDAVVMAMWREPEGEVYVEATSGDWVNDTATLTRP